MRFFSGLVQYTARFSPTLSNFIACLRKRLSESPTFSSLKAAYHAAAEGKPARIDIGDHLMNRQEFITFFRRLSRSPIPENPPKVVIVVVAAGKLHKRFFSGLFINTIYPNRRVLVIETGNRLKNIRDSNCDAFLSARDSHRIPMKTILEQCGDAKYIVFLGPSLEPLFGWLNELVAVLETSPDCCAAAPVIFETSAAPVNAILVRNTGLCFRPERNKIRIIMHGSGAIPEINSAEPNHVPAASLIGTLWRKNALPEHGMLPLDIKREDLSVRIAIEKEKAGEKLICCPSSGLIDHNRRAPLQALLGGDSNCDTEFLTATVRSRCWHEKLTGIPVFWADRPLTVGMIVTDIRPNSVAGDLFTARGLGDALEKLGYRVVYFAERPVYEWHVVSSKIDILLVLRHTFDIRPVLKIPGLLTAAWIRGYVDKWCEKPWFSQYDMVFATSSKALSHACRFIAREKCLGELPLAADTSLFKPGPGTEPFESDIVFVGNLYAVQRQFVDNAELLKKIRFKFFGNLENPNHCLKAFNCGAIPHSRIPDIYNSAKIVLDDCTAMCKPWGCINSRTFEAMACGACVLSNEIPGLRAFFQDSIVTYKDAEDFDRKVHWLLHDDHARKTIGAGARKKILSHHTWDHRAEAFRYFLNQYFIK
jgi:glycosyltransferase involved in cell wall biosynthesis